MVAIEFAYRAFCEERFPLPTEEQVAALERRIGVRLPNDFREFVLSFNGGYFSEPDITPPVPECPADCLHFVRGIGASHPSAELASESSLTIFSDNDPVQVLPIGYTLMGNLLILLTDPEKRGTVMLKIAFSDRYFLLAEGIEEFFSLLRERTED